MIQIKLGDKAKSIAIERFRGVEGLESIVAIPIRDILFAAIHFISGMGYFYCFKGACCQEDGLPSMKYILPTIQYTMRTRAEYESPLVIKFLALGKDSYDKLTLKDEICQDITAKDLLVTCSDAQWQDLNFEILNDAKWKGDKELTDEVGSLLL